MKKLLIAVCLIGIVASSASANGFGFFRSRRVVRERVVQPVVQRQVIRERIVQPVVQRQVIRQKVVQPVVQQQVVYQQSVQAVQPVYVAPIIAAPVVQQYRSSVIVEQQRSCSSASCFAY